MSFCERQLLGKQRYCLSWRAKIYPFLDELRFLGLIRNSLYSSSISTAATLLDIFLLTLAKNFLSQMKSSSLTCVKNDEKVVPFCFNRNRNICSFISVEKMDDAQTSEGEKPWEIFFIATRKRMLYGNLVIFHCLIG